MDSIIRSYLQSATLTLLTMKIKRSVGLTILDMDKEFSFVVLCSLFRPDKTRLEKIVSESRSIEDWNNVLNFIFAHKILPVFYSTIQDTSIQLPGVVMKRIKNGSSSASFKGLRYTASLLKLISLFEKEQIFVIPFKGPVLGKDLYDDTCMRLYSDLDILVSRQEVLKARALLLEKGFMEEISLTQNQFNKFMRYEDHLIFNNQSGTITIELHWELSGFYLTRPLFLTHVRQNLRDLSINKRNVKTFSKENLVVYLCIHGTKHGWSQLEQICCIAELIKQNEIQWCIVKKIIKKWRCRKMFFLGLWLCWKLYGIKPDSKSICQELAKNRQMDRLAEQIITSQLNGFSQKITSRFSSFHFKVRDSRLDKIVYFFRLIFRPTIKDWERFPLPARFSWLFLCLRPYRLLKEGRTR